MADKGLEGVVVAESTISEVDGENGRLMYAGYAIEDLAANVTFEEVCHLLWYGELPSGQQLDTLRGRFNDNASVPDDVLEIVRRSPKAHPMALLRTTVSALAGYDADSEDMSPEANDRKAVRLTAQAITLTAAIERIRTGKDPIKPKPELTLAGNFLYMLWGKEGTETQTRIIDAALTLHAEHGMNASTFAARVTVATLSDMHSGITSAIGTLKGPLHGGANEQVMKMLMKIGTPDNAAQWVRDALEKGDKIMGFGHRVYRTTDPRAPILKDLAAKLSAESGDTPWLDISDHIQTTMREEMDKKGKKIYPNVDFFSASVYYTLGIPLDLFTNIFACARMAGWTAHIIEQLKNNRLIRPDVTYIGPRDRKSTPIAQRV
ncbi:MAG: citrate/2-methylcitrate synthase [Longimicrobiales bacterium]